MEFNLSSVKVKSILSIGAVIAAIILIDALLRIYANWLQIRELKAKNKERFYPKELTDKIQGIVQNEIQKLKPVQ